MSINLNPLWFDAINQWCFGEVVSVLTMESMNKLGDGTHLAGTLAGAKPCMSVSCWPGYATQMNSQPKEMETWANT